LAEVARRIIPDLDSEKAHVGEYVGIRPGTDKRDYQIHLDYPKRWIAAAGIRSTGMCSVISRITNALCSINDYVKSTNTLTLALSISLFAFRTHGESGDRSPCYPFAP
jgi:hypothetical protein